MTPLTVSLAQVTLVIKLAQVTSATWHTLERKVTTQNFKLAGYKWRSVKMLN